MSLKLENIDKRVFFCSSAAYAALFFFIAMWPGQAGPAISKGMDFTVETVGWFYLVAFTTAFVILGYLAFGPYGNITLGDHGDRPDYSFASWIGMLFGAGLGIGLVFFGVYEPLTHYVNPPFGAPKSAEAAQVAFKSMLFHWGLHPWAIYSATGLALAYSKHRKKNDARISGALASLFGEKTIRGPLGKAVDIFSVLAILAGVGTSAGFAASQFSAGLASQHGIPNNAITLVVVTAVICLLSTVSAIKGIAKGIKIISDANMLIVIALLLFAFIFGPSQYLVKAFFESIGIYINDFPSLCLFMDAGGQVAAKTGGDWVGMWSVKNFAWWTAFAPFVGVFLADISKGRTIREFVLASTIVPAILCFMWFDCFGGSAIGFIQSGFFGDAVTKDLLAAPEDSLFVFLRQLPLSWLTVIVAMALVLTLIITSVNAATYAMGAIVTTGKDEPSIWVRAYWGIFLSLNSFLFIWVGGIFTLRGTSLIAAFPFLVIVILLLISTLKSLAGEKERNSRENAG
ncbi:MAG: BCCT family transporter [Deltaproteobacteria bacterium]|jgi:glycine betaine transporter|nr:BCCT family transporter [Deltaproteobacteria bacterium]